MLNTKKSQKAPKRENKTLMGMMRTGSFANLLKGRQNSEKVVKPSYDDLPPPDVLFKEGYLFKRARNSGSGWKRRFFQLQDTELSYAVQFGAPKKAVFEMLAGTTIHFCHDFQSHPHCLEIRPPEESEDHDRSLFVAADSKEIMVEWATILKTVMNKLAGNAISVTPVIARFYEGTLFKTPRIAHKWEAKHFELENGVMYYVDARKGERNLTFKPERKSIKLSGAHLELGKTDATGIPFTGIPFQIQERGSPRIYNLAAPNEAEYKRWLQGIKTWIEMIVSEDQAV